MKKALAFMLMLMLVFASVSALAEYDEQVFFTVCTTKTLAAGDYNSDGLAQYIAEKFNVDWEVWPVASDSHDEKVRVWINSESMPTIATWSDWSYAEYADYVDQGLLRALPEGWEEKYPNLAHMQEVSTLADMAKIDGTTYAIANSTFGVFCQPKVITNHETCYYRKDYATALGYEFGDTVTFSEFKAFLKDCVDNDMSGTGETYGLVAYPVYMNSFFFDNAGIDVDSWYDGEGSMVWGPLDDGALECLEMEREWYQEGLLYPDYYLLASNEVQSYYDLGKAAAIFTTGPVSEHVLCVNGLTENGYDPEECYGCVLVTPDDGVAHSIETTNFWTIIVFNPDTDDETMDRVLSLMDWLATEEGVYTCQMGVKGVEWDFDENGKAYFLDAALNEDGSVKSQYDRNPSYGIWRQLAILSDDFNFVSPAYPTWVQDSCMNCYNVKGEAEVLPISFNYKFFTGESKNVFSVDVNAAITEIVLGNQDIETAWNKFIDDNRGMWEPLMNDMNAEYYAD